MASQSKFKEQVGKFIRASKNVGVSIITNKDLVDTKWGCCLVFVGDGDDVCLTMVEKINNILEEMIDHRDESIDDLVNKVIASDPSVCGRA